MTTETASTTTTAAAEHHVHFDQTTLRDDDFDTDSTCVTYQQNEDNVVVVHLGFLQHNHRYLIELHLPGNLFKCNAMMPINLVADNNAMPNIHCKLADRISELSTQNYENDAGVNVNNRRKSETNQKFYVIKVEYFAYREKLLREELKLINANNSVELLKLVVTARVLGKGKGTPMLRNGIHCLGYEPGTEDESEQSEDQQLGKVSAANSKAFSSKSTH